MPPSVHTKVPQIIHNSATKSIAALHHVGMHLFVTPLSVFISWLSVHTGLAYAVLFLGAYFESLVGPSFFIPGEIFLLGGSILAGTHVLNIWIVIAVLYAGAILGDSSSYFIGRQIGKSIFHERKRVLNIKNYERMEVFFEKYGPRAIFLARLIGPFNKIMPAMAGVFEIPFPTFLMYNLPGILIGVGEFIVAGYFFGDRYEFVLLLIERYVLLLFVIIAVAIFIHWYYVKGKQPGDEKPKDELLSN